LSGALAENNRLANTLAVIDAFKQLMSATRGEVACVVTSAAV
jgi:F0F1-type ATP synthase delta subunit